MEAFSGADGYLEAGRGCPPPPTSSLSTPSSSSSSSATAAANARPAANRPASSAVVPPNATSTRPSLSRTREEVTTSLTSSQASRFRVKDWEVARFAAKVNKEEFRICPSDRSAKSSPSLTAEAGASEEAGGLLGVHLIAGTGLNASNALLRDLYCVVEVDSIRRARSMIRTSTDYFEWDEGFELDFLDGKCLSFLLYHWDPKNRHRLCFYGNLNLRGLTDLLQRGYLKSEKLALKLEPKGLLYMIVHFTEPSQAFRRPPPELAPPGSAAINSAAATAATPAAADRVFGVPLRQLVERERSGHNVPQVVKTCIEEVASRGLDIVGIYRLSGAEKLKRSIREAFEHGGNATVDLRAEKVPDIHAITGKFEEGGKLLWIEEEVSMRSDGMQLRQKREQGSEGRDNGERIERGKRKSKGGEG